MENNNSRKEKLWLFVFGIVMVSILVFAMSIQIKKQDVQINSYYEQGSQYENQSVSGRWIYKGKHVVESMHRKDRDYFDQILEQWLAGSLTDTELTDWMMLRLQECDIDVQTIGVMSQQVCLFESEDDVPDYETRLQNANSIYEFIGLYTDGKKDAEGKLICYYWEAGAR